MAADEFHSASFVHARLTAIAAELEGLSTLLGAIGLTVAEEQIQLLDEAVSAVDLAAWGIMDGIDGTQTSDLITKEL